MAAPLRAPRARNVKAWANGPGQRYVWQLGALKARNRLFVHVARSALYDYKETFFLGHWPRLLHFGPLALRTSSPRHSRRQIQNRLITRAARDDLAIKI